MVFATGGAIRSIGFACAALISWLLHEPRQLPTHRFVASVLARLLPILALREMPALATALFVPAEGRRVSHPGLAAKLECRPRCTSGHAQEFARHIRAWRRIH